MSIAMTTNFKQVKIQARIAIQELVEAGLGETLAEIKTLLKGYQRLEDGHNAEMYALILSYIVALRKCFSKNATKIEELNKYQDDIKADEKKGFRLDIYSEIAKKIDAYWQNVSKAEDLPF